MRIGPTVSSPRLLAARTLAALAEAHEERAKSEQAMTHRIMELRRQIGDGTYRIDPDRVAAALFAAIVTGGI